MKDPLTSADVLTPVRFVQELWGKSPADHWIEFTTITYSPTPGHPDEKSLGIMHFKVENILKDFHHIQQHLQHLNKTQGANIHHGVNPRFRKPDKRGKNTDVESYVSMVGQ